MNNISEYLSILNENKGFIMDAYNINAYLGFILLISIVDVIFRGWAMWRAARMSQKWWFISLLVINSMGIYPIIYLLSTQAKYARLRSATTGTA